ncbi:putative Glycosyltransferase family 92 [Medicago truncatula]|uniref:Glycosyltransferase family 92 protein n=1 Tax=Medicago truncatula TaxID=3880 RepID=A0A072V3C5_MEDTR|nr:glycosyltransferase family 92 protein RCOM_0530710 [Medicago truncatula]KEH36327.1 glycosyltransferase family 92 protein [Medicago truncatula]RHN71231.1 putative Glycosyltransferase family 92 [Medicago truncatula]
MNMKPSSPSDSNISINNSTTTFISSPWETMRRKPRTTLLLSLLSILLFAAFSLHLSRDAVSGWRPDYDLDDRPWKLNAKNHVVVHTNANKNNNIVNEFSHQSRRVSSINFRNSFSTVSVLLPDWEILVLVSPNTPLSSSDEYNCLFRNNQMSQAKFSGVLPFTNRTTFKCDMPGTVWRRKIFSQPMLVTGTSENEFQNHSPAAELVRWNFVVYESFSMEDDVVLFAKGVNHRQGYDRPAKELNCVFQIGDGIRTAVTSSVQEVFRCLHPDPSDLGSNSEIGVSLEIIGENIVVPSVAYYTPRPNKPNSKPVAVQNFGPPAQPKYFLCACTMVYNVAKFLREWVVYHSKVGVENFILYDNGSDDDDLERIIKELREEGYNISTLLWIWPKTQEAGFSHSILYSKSKGLCTWMMYVDVDEFMYLPSWRNNGFHFNSNELPSLKSILPREDKGGRIGQVSMMCLEFGPSGQRQHPKEGVTQGYTCRRKVEQRHKSIVLVEAVDRSLWNVIHHFQVNEKQGFRSKQLGPEEGLVNHYKYQAWVEFKSKFRRRVSAYVVDWRQAMNPNSQDRTPGLGFEAVEPKDWTHRFCEVRDQRLKLLTREWFGSFTHNGYRMAWQTR